MYKCINQPLVGGQCVAPLTQHEAPFWGQSINNWRSYNHIAYFNLTRTIIVKKTEQLLPFLGGGSYETVTWSLREQMKKQCATEESTSVRENGKHEQ